MKFQMFDIVNFSIIPKIGEVSDQIHADGMITGINLIPHAEKPCGWYVVSRFDKIGISNMVHFCGDDIVSDECVSERVEFIRHGTIEEFTEIFNTGG